MQIITLRVIAMRNYWKGCLVFGLLSLSATSYAQHVDVNSLHYAQAAQQTRMIFDVSASPKHRVFVQNHASQLVIEIKNAQLAKTMLNQPAATHPLFAKLHILDKTKDALRLAIDLKQPVTAKNFLLASNNKDEHKLIIDLINKNNKSETNRKAIANKPPTEQAAQTETPAKKELLEHKKNPPAPVATPEPSTMLAMLDEVGKKAAGLKKAVQHISDPKDKVVIAIDAGHGGEDPGAHGLQGTEEKQVVFAIAKKLAKLINAQPDMKAVMVRKGDYYVGLRKRMQLARKANADLFISIHADAFQDATVKGSSVYVLSRSGASSEAALWLAKSENASDLIGGVSLEDKEDVLASVLLDLSQSATEEVSLNVAKSVLKNCRTVGGLHKNEVQNAGFMVLKSPDIPSILVETAFISNPDEEQNLLNIDYQTKMAAAIFNGVREYFKPDTLPTDTKVAAL
jgi:N-acetylmuramoyl-L-alanine amidase